MADHKHAFEFHADGSGAMAVLSLHAVEQISDVYSVDVMLKCPSDDARVADIEGALLGRAAAVDLHAGTHKRRLQGVVTQVRIATLDDALARIAVRVAPRLALLKLRRTYRIFQDKSVKQIADELLREWSVPCKFDLSAPPKARPYVTQHGETDFDFLRRILALEGIGFYFSATHAEGKVTDAADVVFFDSPTYHAIPSGTGEAAVARVRNAPVLRHAHKNFEYGADDIHDFDMLRTLGPRNALLSDFDFRRPQFGMRATSHADRAPGVAPSEFERGQLFDATYYHDRLEYEGTSHGPEIDDDRAQMTFEQMRRDVRVAHGKTRSVRPLPGHIFALEGHSIDALNAAYLVTRVEHHGKSPETVTDGQLYDVELACVPAEVVYRPPVEAGFHAVSGTETATVVGPDGEDVYTDEHGRVKVRFHWDAHAKGDEKSSCWLRVAQGWSGSRWGTQYMPRVGMEVMVTYLGGDVDRPVVTGCLYNATHPPPFRLPEDRHKSGVRTVSSDGAGHNELSFQDRAGEEQVFLQAHRDLDVEVGRDQKTFIERDETHRVGGSQTLSVEGGRTERMNGPSTLAVGGSLTQTVRGDADVSVQGDRTENVAGSLESRVGGDLITRVDGDVLPDIRGRAQIALNDDAIIRAEGHLVAVVGKSDAKKSLTLHVDGTSELYSTGTNEITSEKTITIRVGTSSIRISDKQIEIAADTLVFRSKEHYALAEEKMKLVGKKESLWKSDKKIFLQAEGSSLQLTKDARLDGGTVKLNCAPDPVDDKVPEKKEIKPTKFSLVDDKGAPMKNQRIVLVMSDGSERTAVLDDEGKCELELEDSGKVVFPDVSKPETA